MAVRKKKSLAYKGSSRGEPDPEPVRELGGWMVAERGEFYRPVKEQITLRLDKDVVAWFKAGGAGYQTRINDALREYVLAKLTEESR
jgi:uncharacterized protein (DUF4415 family)